MAMAVMGGQKPAERQVSRGRRSESKFRSEGHSSPGRDGEGPTVAAELASTRRKGPAAGLARARPDLHGSDGAIFGKVSFHFSPKPFLVCPHSSVTLLTVLLGLRQPFEVPLPNSRSPFYGFHVALGTEKPEWDDQEAEMNSVPKTREGVYLASTPEPTWRQAHGVPAVCAA